MKQLLLLIILIPQIVLAEDIYFKVIETTPAWTDINFPNRSNISFEIPQGSIVKGATGVRFAEAGSGLEKIPLQLIFYREKRTVIYANSIIPVETQDLFEEDLIYNPESPLISSFFLDALRQNNRELIYLHDKSAWDDTLKQIEEFFQEKRELWGYVSAYNDLIIAQTSLGLYPEEKADSELLIKNIKKNSVGYIVTVQESVAFLYENNRWNWPIKEKKDLFDVLLIPDGDYIDLYLGDKSRLIDTFVFTNEEVITQLNNLINGSPVDLTRVAWPRRADGSTDFDTQVDITNYVETHRTIDSLRLRDTPSTAARIVTVLPKNAGVQLIETGNIEIIDNITAPWVKILTVDGGTGWCFSGYLTTINEPEKQPIVFNESQVQPPTIRPLPPAVVEEPAQESEQPRLFPLVMVGLGVFLLIVIITVIVAKRKKK